jgi:hypothetical protein
LGGGGPPPKPSFAPGAFSDGSYVVFPEGSTRRDGYERNGTTTYFGGGLFPPYSGTLSVGGSGTLVTLCATKTPVATAQVTASNAGNGNRPAQGDLALGYSVVIHAANAAANALTPFLSHSGALAAASGFVTLDATGQAFSQGAVRTGVPSALAVPVQKVVYFACDPTGYTRLGTAGCGTHAYSIDVNFVNGSAFGNVTRSTSSGRSRSRPRSMPVRPGSALTSAAARPMSIRRSPSRRSSTRRSTRYRSVAARSRVPGSAAPARSRSRPAGR